MASQVAQTRAGAVDAARGSMSTLEHVAAVELEMILQLWSKTSTRHHQHTLAWYQALEPVHGLLGGRPAAKERKQLLGAVGCAERPEPGARSAGQYYRPPHETARAEPTCGRKTWVTSEKSGESRAVNAQVVEQGTGVGGFRGHHH
jgi:hypothetical protein